MTHYRVPFFETLRRHMQQAGLELLLAHGEGTPDEQHKQDGGTLDWAHKLSTRYIAGGRLCWQPFGDLHRRSALSVVTAENKLLYNLCIQYGSRDQRVALWGHGGNLQGDPDSWRERFKRRVSHQADWWFAYTDMSAAMVSGTGYPAERISVLDNAVDTSQLAAQLSAVDDGQRSALRERLGLKGQHVGVFVGSLYPDKRLPFLLQAATAIRGELPDFELLIVGTGAQRELVDTFCSANRWAHALGVRKGAEKAELLSIAHLMLNPGLVGLGILDSFVAGVPMVTTDCGLHSPEIAYLDQARNGWMSADNVDAYSQQVIALFKDDALRENLRQGCAEAARRYTLDNMAARFTAGALGCLSRPPLR